VRFPPPTRHTLIHCSDWEARIRDRLPEFLPPAFIDPERKPRRNQLHGARSSLRKRSLPAQLSRCATVARNERHSVAAMDKIG